MSDILLNHVLIITPKQISYFGGGVMNKRNIDLISEISREQTIYEIIPAKTVTNTYKVTKYFSRAVGYIAGLRKSFLVDIFEIIKLNPNIDSVCVNSSLYGLVAKKIKQRFPALKLIVFFHNAEYQYAIEEWKLNKKSFKSVLQIINFAYAEYLSLKYSDLRFVLSRRDSFKLKKLQKNKENCILPMSIEDKGKIDYEATSNGRLRLLFVGSAFFANIQGIRWFCQNVMPNVNAELVIVGNEMDKLKSELETDNIIVVGRVEDLKDYYQKADIVVSPIFYGSGMKTKTVEAMMYGLPVIGTEEAFVGFDFVEKFAFVANTQQDFISIIEKIEKSRKQLIEFSNISRLEFENNYSIESSLALITNYIQNYNLK